MLLTFLAGYQYTCELSAMSHSNVYVKIVLQQQSLLIKYYYFTLLYPNYIYIDC